MNLYTYFAASLRLTHAMLSIQHPILETIQDNSWIERNVLHAKHDMHWIAELSLPRDLLGSRLPKRRLVAGECRMPFAERETFAVETYTLVPVALRVLF